MSTKYRVIRKAIEQSGEEAEIVAKGLSYAEALQAAQKSLGDYVSRFICQFEVTVKPYGFEAVRRIESGSAWGIKISLELEPEEKQFSLSDLRKAFEELSQIIRLEYCDPERDRFLMGDIENDVLRVLSGEIGVQSGEVVFNR